MEELARGVVRGERRSVARALSLIEEEGRERDRLIGILARGRDALQAPPHVVGITGPPGAGKSSLCDQLVAELRRGGQTAGVIAVDPTSPFSGGAVLGDRIRLNRHATDPGVFVRSIGTRGSVGGLSRSVRDAVRVLSAGPFDVVFVETVGVGQSELDVLHVADTVVVVLTPAGGDHIQAAKAGLMEIADVFVVNKSDLPGADRAVQDILGAVRAGRHSPARTLPVSTGPALVGLAHTDSAHAGPVGAGDWEVPVLSASSLSGKGAEDGVETLRRRWSWLQQEGRLARRRGAGLRREFEEVAGDFLRKEFLRRLREDHFLRAAAGDVESGVMSPAEGAERAVRYFFDN